MLGGNMKTTKSEELYLVTIYELSKKMELVKCADLARSLGYSRPSTLGLINKLIDKELVYRGEKKCLLLTDSGLKIARTISNRHNVLKAAFIGLGASKELAEKEARNMENHISDEMLKIIDNHIEIHLKDLKDKNMTLEQFENQIKNRYE